MTIESNLTMNKYWKYGTQLYGSYNSTSSCSKQNIKGLGGYTRSTTTTSSYRVPTADIRRTTHSHAGILPWKR